MGKFFEALKKSEAPKRQPPPPPASEKVIKISTDTVEPLKLDTTPPEVPEEELHYSNIGLDSRLISYLQPNSPAGECFKILRAKLLVSAPNKSVKAIMVSSPEPLDGKTLVAANLGLAIASGMNEHVLLVDCDLRRPSLHQRFGVKVTNGLREYLEGSISLATCLLDTPANKLRLLPGGKAPPNPSELLSSEKMRRLVRELKDRYEDRYVIFDAPPAQFTAETTFLSSMMDGVLLVVRSGKTAAPLISQAIENIGRENVLGVVFNASREREKDYYRYHYRYYREGRP
jgi:capsular exopolysaccharide synthesis family protein